MRQYFLRLNEPKYGGQLVGGVIINECEVQQWTWYAHTAPDTLSGKPEVVFEDWSDYRLIKTMYDVDWTDPTV